MNLEQTIETSFLGKVRNSLGRIRSSIAGKIVVYSLAGVLGAGLGYGCGVEEKAEKESWPVGESSYDHYISSPLIVDLAKNGKQQVIVDVWHGDWNGVWKKRIYVLNEHGNNLKGWPKDSLFTFPSRSQRGELSLYQVAVGDLEGDGAKEVIYWDRDETNPELEQISAVHYDGTPATNWPIYGEKLPTYLIAEDFNNDGKAEVLGVKEGGEISVFQSGGKIVPGWPKNLTSNSSALGFGDIDQNGDLEIILVKPEQLQAWHYEGSNLLGYPLNYQALGTTLCAGPSCRFISPLFFGDTDKEGNLELILQTSLSETEENNDNRGILIIDAINKNIKYEWPLPCLTIDDDSSLKALVLSGIGDVDQDGDLELVFNNYCQKDGAISVYHHDGSWLADLLMSKEDAVHSSGAALVADLDAALGLEIVNKRRSWQDDLGGAFPASLQIYNGLTGELLQNIEFGFENYVELGQPAVGDLDGDGNPDLVESGYVHYVGGKVNKWEFKL